ncbi:MAG: FxsA family protein [Pseudomonadota bacterium]|nr:FxsA family protein [Pseudomonadota bacterium]MEC9392696.1 FxsA family protein [Pseudomonadota bacterium]
MFYFLFLFIIGLPVLEIWILIKLGSIFGFWGTLLLVIGTAIFGLFHLRVQGFELIFNLQKKLLSGQKPVAELAEGFGLVISGFFFIIPGAITDLVGLIFLIPYSRRFFLRIIINYIIDRLREKGH